jgi:hypothetical protein
MCLKKMTISKRRKKGVILFKAYEFKDQTSILSNNKCIFKRVMLYFTFLFYNYPTMLMWQL